MALINKLTAIADSIREKTGKADVLTLDQMPLEIAGIQTGVELGFEVVGGTTAPSNPKENTIWVNTDAEITGWVFSAVEPEAPAEGTVWISTGLTSPVEFNALGKNSIQICPTYVKQYVDGVWVDKSSKSYIGSAWVDWLLYLYNMGDECKGVTGGWQARAWRASSAITNATAPTITKNADSMEVAFFAGASGVAEVANNINFSGYKTMYCRCTKISNGSDPFSRARLVIVSRNATYYATNAVASVDIKSTGTLSINISSLDPDTSYDVVIGGAGRSDSSKYAVTVDKIWCE